jgi:hypothetical protein
MSPIAKTVVTCALIELCLWAISVAFVHDWLTAFGYSIGVFGPASVFIGPSIHAHYKSQANALLPVDRKDR